MLGVTGAGVIVNSVGVTGCVLFECSVSGIGDGVGDRVGAGVDVTLEALTDEVVFVFIFATGCVDAFVV